MALQQWHFAAPAAAGVPTRGRVGMPSRCAWREHGRQQQGISGVFVFDSKVASAHRRHTLARLACMRVTSSWLTSPRMSGTRAMSFSAILTL